MVSDMEKMHRFTRLSLVFSLIAVFLFTSVRPVQAAVIGQQVKVMACSAVRVVVQGKNQNGVSVKYTMNKSPSNCAYITIPGWWWTGTITATAYYNVTPEYPYFKGQVVTKALPTTQRVYTYKSVTFSTPTARRWILWRAQTWVTDAVPYDQSSTHDGYRQDCSGFVSFAWQLPKPGTSPAGMSAYSYQIPFDSLLPGDALNNPSAHVMLFIKWVDQSQGILIIQQEEYPGSGTRQRTVTLNKTTGVIQYYSGVYKAIRKNGL